MFANSTRIMISIAFAVSSWTIVLPGGQGATCETVLGNAGWVCNPQPDVEALLSECLRECDTRTYYLPGPDGPPVVAKVWRVSCRIPGPWGFSVENVSLLAVEEPSCPQPASLMPDQQPILLVHMETPVESGPDWQGLPRVKVVTGFCQAYVDANIYGGLGVNGVTVEVPCASVVP